MKGRQRILAVAIIGALLATFLLGSTGTVAATGCPTCPTPAGEGKVMGTLNPAAVYCQQMGYQYDIREDEAGNQYGVCIFPDGSECDAWCFLKGKCGKNYSYCAKKGYDTETERIDKGGYYTECAVCISRHGGEEIRIPMLELMEENGEPLIEAQPYEVNGSCKKECPECEASNIKSSRDDRLPTTFDWRNVDGHTYIGPIRNQSTCGSCYAFAAAASAEGTYNWATGNYDDNCADFSESFIIWCLGRLPEYYPHFYGCDGADYDYYELEALTVEGICNESDFPYTVNDPGECTHWDDPTTVFSSWDRILCNDIDAIKTAIMTYGVIDAAVLATSSFSSYSGGIYSDSNTSCYSSPCYYTPTNHAIALVGWGHDDTYGDYWLLRNSWGASWGEDGYMRIAMTSALVACEATYLTWSTTSPPTIASVNPNSGVQGETLEVTIGGTGFTGATAVGFGDGIAVNSFTVVSATQITANISISATATPGLRDVSVTTPNGTGTLTDGFTVVATSGPVSEEWNKTFGGSDHDWGNSVAETSDGGYIITGATYSYGAGNSDVYLIKTDADGNALWSWIYGGSNNDYGESVVETTDGSYIIAGCTSSFGAGGYDAWLIKTDADGNALGYSTYGGSDNDYGYSVAETSDGGYVIAGNTYSYGAGFSDVWLIKTDANGTTEWDETFGGSDYDFGYSVVETSDGSYVIAGSTYSYGVGATDAYLIKTDATGNQLWGWAYGGSDYDYGRSVVKTPDGGYAIAGSTYSYGAGSSDVWLIKTDADGNMLWNKTFGGSSYDSSRSLAGTSDGGYAIAGSTYSYGAGSADVWLIKTDANGIKEWDETFGGSDEDHGYSVAQTSDGGYIITGTTFSYGAGSEDVWLIKVGVSDTTLPTVSGTSPSADATGVAVDTVITATFSEAMDSSTITTGSFTLDGVSGSVTYDNGTYTATFTPSANLSYSTAYTATLSTAITDTAGNPLASAYSWSFTTASAPPGEVIVSIDAPDDAVAPDSDFTANVNISEVVGFDACNYDVSFDASVLQLDNVTSGLIGATTIPVDMYNEIIPGTYRIIQNVPGLAGVSGSGYLAVLHFHVIGSEGDSSTISLANGMLSDSSAEEITATWVGDSVDVTSVVPGDANGDGNVNALDITKVERIISGLDAETPGADANQDGNINALDITKIEIIIAGLG